MGEGREGGGKGGERGEGDRRRKKRRRRRRKKKKHGRETLVKESQGGAVLLSATGGQCVYTLSIVMPSLSSLVKDYGMNKMGEVGGGLDRVGGSVGEWEGGEPSPLLWFRMKKAAVFSRQKQQRCRSYFGFPQLQDVICSVLVRFFKRCE